MTASHRYLKFNPAFFLLIDLISLNLGVLIASKYRFDLFLPPTEYLLAQLILNIVWIIIFFVSRLHETNLDSRLIDHLNKVLTGLVIKLSIVFALWFVLQPVDQNDQVYLQYSRKFLFVTILVFSLLIVLWRVGLHYFISYYRLKGYNIKRVVIIGKGELSDSLSKYFVNEPNRGYRLIGIYSVDNKAIFNVRKLEEYLIHSEIDYVFCCLPYVSDDQAKDIINVAENNLIKVNLISQFSKLGSYNLSIEQFDNIPVIKVNTIPLESITNRFIKRMFDIVFSSFFIVFVLSWMIPIVGILIRVESKGPIFFRQARHGRGNQNFMCLKFRTMVYNKKAEFKQATKNDHRVTKVGSILRRMSIDEIPQFINVFIGDMSVVGPRPHPIKLNEEYQPKIDRFWQRHAVRPGITGLAQAKGFRGETVEFQDMSGRVKLDRFYVKNWSLLLDFKIVILTTIAILKGHRNAY